MKVKEVITLFFKKKLKSDDSKNISRNFSETIVGNVVSVWCQVVPCSSLYLFSRSIVALKEATDRIGSILKAGLHPGPHCGL